MTVRKLVWAAVAAALLIAAPVAAQQRPLVTEDPEVIGAGLILLEGGFDASEGRVLSRPPDCKGNLLRLPTLGLSIGVSSIAELQIDGGLYNRLNITHRALGPRRSAHMLNFTGDSTHVVEDMVVATKIRHGRRDAGASGLRLALRDQAAEREQRERPRSRHDRLPRAAAHRQDRAVGPHRRQHRSRHPRRPDARRQPERRARIRLLGRARRERRARDRRRA